MSTIARCALLCHGSWTFDSEPSIPTSPNQQHQRTPSASMAELNFSPPLQSDFNSVTHLTVSNCGDLSMQDLVKMLNSMPHLEELELCRVDIFHSTTGPFVRSTCMVSSLKRLAIEACDITQGLSDAHYDLLFRFLSLFERIECLRLVASLFRLEDHFYHPNFDNLCLPRIVHLEAEGFFAQVLLAFCSQGYPVEELISLHLSRCFSTWLNVHWIAGIVRAVAPTLQHLAFRPNLTASPNSVRNWPALCLDFGGAIRLCNRLTKLELGLYEHGQSGPGSASVYDDATLLFRHILEALPAARLDHLAFVIDIEGPGGLSPDIVPWASLDALLRHVCVRHASVMHLHFCWYEPDAEKRNVMPPVTEYSDPRFWHTRLPTMGSWTTVHSWTTANRLLVGQYAAPVVIEKGRTVRFAVRRLRSLFEQR